jgi:hypothetical protein
MPLHRIDAAAIRVGGEEAGEGLVQITQDYLPAGAQYAVSKRGHFV